MTVLIEQNVELNYKLAFRAALPRDVATAEPSMGARICLACTASVSTFETWQRLHHISFSTPFASTSLNKPLLHTPHTPEPACRAQECFQKHIKSIKTQSQKMSGSPIQARAPHEKSRRRRKICIQ